MKEKSKSARLKVPQLNVRSDYAVRRARELAQRGGTTTTKVVEAALRAYQLPQGESEEALWRRLHEITGEVARHGPYATMKDSDDELYDEWGVPR